MSDCPRDPRDPSVQPADRASYQATPESIERAKQAAAVEREEFDRAATDFMIRRERALNTLTGMVAEFGAPVVESWLRHVVRGERP